MVFVGAYWSARESSREEAAAKIGELLRRISSCKTFSSWFLRAKNAEETHMRVDASSEWIALRLDQNTNDVTNQPIHELGFSFVIYNSAEDQWQAAASLRIRIGSTSPHVPNVAVVSFGAKSAEAISRAELEMLLRASIDVFDPDHAVITSHERLERAGAKEPWEAGLVTYDRGGPIKGHGEERVGKYEALMVA